MLLRLLHVIESTDLSHVKCQGNKPTDLLAKFAQKIDNINNYVTWMEESPLLIESAIAYDLLNLSFS